MKAYFATSLNDGREGALNRIDGEELGDQDAAMVVTDDRVYFYYLDASSGKPESEPDIIDPIYNGTDKRWILKGVIDLKNVSSTPPTGMYLVKNLFVDPITMRVEVEYDDTPEP